MRPGNVRLRDGPTEPLDYLPNPPPRTAYPSFTPRSVIARPNPRNSKPTTAPDQNGTTSSSSSTTSAHTTTRSSRNPGVQHEPAGHHVATHVEPFPPDRVRRAVERGPEPEPRDEPDPEFEEAPKVAGSDDAAVGERDLEAPAEVKDRRPEPPRDAIGGPGVVAAVEVVAAAASLVGR